MREKCNNCVRPSKSCISYLMTLSTREMLEWCRIWKERMHMSNAMLAEKSRVPKGTIDRILSKAKDELGTADVKLVTVRPLICAIIGCTIDELCECETGFEARSVLLAEKNALLTEQLMEAKSVVALYREQNAMYKKQLMAQSKLIKDYEKRLASIK